MSWEDHRVYLEGVPPYGLQTTPYERASSKEEVQSLPCRRLTFLPPDAAAPLFHLEWSVGEFSNQLFPLLAGREPLYKEALDWLQFAFTGDTKFQYAAPSDITFSFLSPVEGGPLFLPALERLQTLYPGAYNWGATSTHEVAELEHLNVKLSMRTHLGTAGLSAFLGGGDPSPIQPSSLVGAAIDESPDTRKSWLDVGSAYGGQRNLNYQHWRDWRSFLPVDREEEASE